MKRQIYGNRQLSCYGRVWDDIKILQRNYFNLIVDDFSDFFFFFANTYKIFPINSIELFTFYFTFHHFNFKNSNVD